MIENMQNQFRFSHVQQGHRKWRVTAKHGRWTWFTAYTIIHTLSTITSVLTGILRNFRDRCSLSSSYSLTAAESEKKKTSSADMSRTSSAQIGFSFTCTQRSQHHARGSCQFSLFWGLFTEKNCMCPCKKFSAASDNISSNVDLSLCLAVLLFQLITNDNTAAK